MPGRQAPCRSPVALTAPHREAAVDRGLAGRRAICSVGARVPGTVGPGTRRGRHHPRTHLREVPVPVLGLARLQHHPDRLHASSLGRDHHTEAGTYSWSGCEQRPAALGRHTTVGPPGRQRYAGQTMFISNCSNNRGKCRHVSAAVLLRWMIYTHRCLAAEQQRPALFSG
jgi:hypothetical protein